jgi:hypothetical protein
MGNMSETCSYRFRIGLPRLAGCLRYRNTPGLLSRIDLRLFLTEGDGMDILFAFNLKHCPPHIVPPNLPVRERIVEWLRKRNL